MQRLSKRGLLTNPPFSRAACPPPPAALTAGVLWCVDRATFRSLVVYSMAERRRRHEATLRGVPIFGHLTQQQLAAIADCLRQETYQVWGCGWGRAGKTWWRCRGVARGPHWSGPRGCTACMGSLAHWLGWWWWRWRWRIHMQAGDVILREGMPLDDAAKFYVLERGAVDCFRSFEVRRGRGGGGGRGGLEAGGCARLLLTAAANR